MQLGIQGNLAFPIGEFRNTVNNSFGGTGFGSGFHFLLNPKKGLYSPVYLGVDFNYLNFGNEKIPESKFYPPLKTTFNFLTLGPMFRVFLKEKEAGLIPFIDGMFGMKIMNTKTRVDNSFLATIIDQEVKGTILGTNYEGFVSGIGVGFFSKKQKKEADDLAASFFFKLMIQHGDKTKYIKRNSIEINSDGDILYQNARSPISLINLQFGILVW
ncbi:hypothetical protein [Algoriphagus mannitolivorans]|uniref:hypothetical protein n=1 Tax=Algoriphagus mannitolivorans TaxID=226504 RepID=UPI000427B6F2|nr:hypothetical protein [Algoriphagus mannitolivorans]